MNVGDYVRYKYENIVYIGKIKFISETMGFDETLQFDIDNCMEEILKQDIIKSSPQIIDLIEVGDYVNGKKVIDVYSDYIFDYSEEFKVIRFSETDILHNSEHIETVLTHEQMEAMQYRVEE